MSQSFCLKLGQLLTVMLLKLLKFVRPAVVQPNSSISADQKPDGNKAHDPPSLLQQMSRPSMQIIHFTSAREFFANHWGPNRLVLMEPLL